ncbi:MAG: tetratricopeptide repeat protein [bacterium]|nr:tetratricopeptide repeat protein [bacterium]
MAPLEQSASATFGDLAFPSTPAPFVPNRSKSKFEVLDQIDIGLKKSSQLTVAIQPLGASSHYLELVQAVIEDVFKMNAKVLSPITLEGRSWDLRRCYNSGRAQFDADDLLLLLFDNMVAANADRIIGLLHDDAYAENRNFVLGYAHLRDGTSLLSTARLDERRWFSSEERNGGDTRITKVTLHEMGHTFGLPHCEHWNCVMHAVGPVFEINYLPLSYCRKCVIKVRQGLRVNPHSAEAAYRRGGALLRHRRLPEAIAAYGMAIKKNSRKAEYWNDLGAALHRSGQKDAARDAFFTATIPGADYPRPYYNLGILCYEDGSVEKAARWFEEGLNHDPNKRDGHKFVGKLYDDFKDPARARRHYKEYVNSGGEDQEVVRRYWYLASY